MTQKDKVKELVGRGLNSYHTKALQQMDRIEKKNKEQNHKISILTNELDNDYLTKTEEGSVISLEHSKEGMVYLDELQGNTLVNYCTDGSKELTLNGDIDLEGTFVTTTEGVDNGKVDVLCEGNTLVGEFLRIPTPSLQGNEFDDFTIVDKNDYWECRGIANKDNIVMSVNSWSCELGLKALKEGVEYTVIVYDCPSNSMMKNYLIRDNNIGENFNTVIGVNKWKIVAKSEGLKYGFYSFSKIVNLGEECIINFPKKVLLLEGDWTNKEIPPYFEGMKSVGQDDENGHKIEILSQNKNLYNPTNFKNANTNGITFSCENGILTANGTSTSTTDLDFEKNIPFYFQKGKMYSLKTDILSDNLSYPSHTLLAIKITNRNGNISWTTFKITDGVARTTFDGNNIEKIERVRFYTTGANHTFTNFRARTQLEEGSANTTYVSYAMNKKEILINEPLRKGNTEVKDRIIKLNNKWYVERNYEEIVLDGSYDWKINGNGTIYYNTTIFSGNKYVLPTLNNKVGNIVCDKRIVTYIDYIYAKEPNSVIGYIGITKDGNLGMSLDNKTPEQIKAELTSNPIRVILQLKTPVYEPLEVEPTLNTYNDVTHISNNSIIPCNMKIQNSGYNAIIKPSTLYTVALDTNKSGTIGMNLGGAKGTTTNNVLTLTTSATLTDDSLRLYGKGIKGSKVRLLEGDKTNWIPSHFEGMKSSFEDKFDATDNTYKMEILSNNSNVFNLEECIQLLNSKTICVEEVPNGFRTIQGKSQMFNQTICKFNPKGRYKVSYDITSITSDGSIATQTSWFIRVIYKDGEEQRIYNPNGHIEFATKDKPIQDINMSYGTTQNISTITNIKIVEMKSDTTEEYKSNKIQFSSIEPLRSVDNVKDRFVFKDNKLMVERNCGVYTYNGATQQQWQIENFGVSNYTKFVGYNFPNALSERCKSNLASCGTDKAGISVRIAPTVNRVVFVNNYFQDISNTTERIQKLKEYLNNNNLTFTYQLTEPTYEEIPFELQKIILEGYKNGTLFFDTNIPPTSTVTYAGETPIVKSVKLNKTEVLNNTNDINDNIIPYLMDMDYRVVCLQLQSEEFNGGVAMAKLFGGAYEMLQRDIQSKRYSVDEYRHRLDAYLGANKITEDEYNKLGDMLNE